MTNTIITFSKSPPDDANELAVQVLRHLEETIDLYAELRRRVRELDVITETATRATAEEASGTVTAAITKIVDILEAAVAMRR